MGEQLERVRETERTRPGVPGKDVLYHCRDATFNYLDEREDHEIFESKWNLGFISFSNNNYENPVYWLYLLVCDRGLRFRPSPSRFSGG